MSPWRRARDAVMAMTSPRWGAELIRERTPSMTTQDMTTDQMSAIHLSSAIAASASILAGLLTLYWFFRMRRSFRHDIIMLLILCDMHKAAWFLIISVYEMVHGYIESSSSFCQGSGFMLAMAIEASDIAIIMVSVHAALYVFRGKHGLYPFRIVAYALLVGVPVLLSSLAFVNKVGYVNTGQFCYLPVAPFWTRMALSWVPRYFTFVVIFLLAAAIYFYVRVLMKRFGATKEDDKFDSLRPNSLLQNDDPLELHDNDKRHGSLSSSIPATNRHGLISSLMSSRRGSKEDRPRKSSVSTTNTLHMDFPPPVYTNQLHSYRRTVRRHERPKRWTMDEILVESPLAMYHQGLRSEPDLNALVEAETPHGGNGPSSPKNEVLARAMSINSSPGRDITPILPSTDSSFVTAYNTHVPSTAPGSRTTSIPNVLGEFRRGSSCQTSLAPTHDDMSPQEMCHTHGMAKSREKIHRQLLHLFIYPAVYVVVWIIPFIVHLTSFGKGAPFGMRVTSIVCLSLHGFFDAAVFSLREKPWKHSSRRDRGKCDLRFWKRSTAPPGPTANVGRTREEMRAEGRLARQRRDMEMAERRREVAGSRTNTAQWWDEDP